MAEYHAIVSFTILNRSSECRKITIVFHSTGFRLLHAGYQNSHGAITSFYKEGDVLSSASIYHANQSAKSSSRKDISIHTADLILSGAVVLAHRPLTFPSRPIKNFSKFHLTLFNPMRPGFASFIHSHTGSALSPLTSVLPSTGNVTP